MINFNKQFDEKLIKASLSDAKVGLLSTIDDDKYPRISLISTITANKDNTISWGQFSRGISKENIKKNKKTGFLILNTDKEWWTGKTLYDHEEIKGTTYEFFNNKPLFRYNSYFNIGAIHIHKLVGVSEQHHISVGKVLIGQIKSSMMKANDSDDIKKLPDYGKELANNSTALKFLSYIDGEGYPITVPVLQAKAKSNNVFTISKGEGFLDDIPDGSKVALFVANFKLVSILVQGTWQKHKASGRLIVDKVYNSILPLPKYIYPAEKIPKIY